MIYALQIVIPIWSKVIVSASVVIYNREERWKTIYWLNLFYIKYS